MKTDALDQEQEKKQVYIAALRKTRFRGSGCFSKEMSGTIFVKQ